MKRALVTLAVLVLPAVSFADNVGGCGWGTKLFDGQKGIAPQVLAITTNGTLGNQTFGISSGTAGCTADGVVRSNWRTAMFINENMNRLASDMSRGEGESLESLASLAGVESTDRVAFKTVLQQNFGSVFSRSDVSSEEVRAKMITVLGSNDSLAKYVTNI